MSAEPELTLRPFRDGDGEAVVALWGACGLLHPANDPWKDFARKAKVDPDLFLVGVRDGKVVASAMIGYEGHRGWIYYLAVDPAHRGRGLGRQVVAEAERLLRARGCPKVNLLVRKTNLKVLGFYQALGYQADEVISLGKRLERD